MTQQPHIKLTRVRLSFPKLDKMAPRAKGVDKLAYQATFLLPPDYSMDEVRDAVKAAMLDKWGKPIPLKGRGVPVKPAADFDYAGYDEGWSVLAANSDRPIGLVDGQKVPVTDPEEIRRMFYPGCWVNALVRPYAWDHPAGGRGVSWGLLAVQFAADGERIGGGSSIDLDAEFSAIEAPKPAEGKPAAGKPAAGKPAAAGKGFDPLGEDEDADLPF